MSNTTLRQQIKKALDQLPADRLASVADYVAFLTRPPLAKRVALAEKQLRAGKGSNWRKVRNDV